MTGAAEQVKNILANFKNYQARFYFLYSCQFVIFDKCCQYIVKQFDDREFAVSRNLVN